MVTPKKALEIITDIKFEPLGSNKPVLKVINFKKLKWLEIIPGGKIEVSGYVTSVGPVHGREKGDSDVHFNLSPTPSPQDSFLVCEIQNASNNLHRKPLVEATSGQRKVQVRGIFRMFLEHIHKVNHSPHIFELHPVDYVKIEGQLPLAQVEMDAPNREEWKANESIHRITIRNDGSVTFEEDKVTKIEDSQVRVQSIYDGTNLTFKKTKSKGFANIRLNYVSTKGFFKVLSGGQFIDGRPYIFELQVSSSPNSRKIKAVTVPDTPAYEVTNDLHKHPPNSKVTVVALRSLSLGELFNSNYEIMLCPVYRLEK
jgi:hypothetical protein